MPIPQPTPADLRQLAWGYAPTLIVETALRVGVFDNLNEMPASTADLAKRTGTQERSLEMILNILVALGLLELDPAALYRLTSISSNLLVSSKPEFQGGLLKNVTKSIKPWLQLEEVVRSGRPARAANRMETGEELYRDSVESLFSLSYPSTLVLAWSLDLKKVKRTISVLDVGAGSGIWGIGLSKASSHVHVTAIDWPQVISITKNSATRHGVAERFTFIEGDMRTAELNGPHDIVILGHVLHGEGETVSKLLLRRVFDVLSPGGTIVIAEFLVNADRSGPLLSLIFGLAMLINTEHGGTFSFEEISSWLSVAGFTDVRQLKTPGPSPLILATRP